MIMPILDGKAAQNYIESTVKGVTDPHAHAQNLATTHAVEGIIQDVITHGDASLYQLAQRFNDALEAGEPIALSEKDWQSACDRIPEDVKASLEEAVANIRLFGEKMMQSLPTEPILYEHHGYRTGFVLRPVEKVACYVPAGRYPLVSSAMMTAITAQVAGVKELVLLCANPADEILYVAQLAGVQSVFKIGGAQALAAVAYGTTQVPKMDMVVGPGNRFVVEAKRQLNGRIGIDSLAGPSEALLIVDETANLSFVASDLLGQAEHDPDARITLLTHDAQVADALQAELESALKLLDLPAFVRDSSLQNSVN